MMKKRQAPLAPGVITVDPRNGVYGFTPIPQPLKKPPPPPGTKFSIVSACCQIVSGIIGPNNEPHIIDDQTFWSVRVNK